MRLGGWTLLAGVGVALGAFALAGACAYPSVPPPPASAGKGGNCTTAPGAFPPPDCDDTANDCHPVSPACPTAPCDGTSSCLAMAQNAAAGPADLRIRKLNITAPPALVTPFLQHSIIDQGVNLKNLCGEGGDGSFSWLIHFDTSAKLVTTGGAPPTPDPFTLGYCFVNEQINGLNVKPVTVGVRRNADGTWTSDTIPKLYVPIYVHGSTCNVVILPLTNARVQQVTLAGNGNCIGSYNAIGAGTPADVGVTTCMDQDYSGCQRWHSAGSLGGFITLEEADGVWVQDLTKSLCVLLTKAIDYDSTGHCSRDATGKIIPTGDYCSRTNAPGGCADSAWLAATIAASAVKINDGSHDPACNGTRAISTDNCDGGTPIEAGVTDAGDAQSSADAGPG